MNLVSLEKARELERLEALPIVEGNYDNQRKAKAMLREFVKGVAADPSQFNPDTLNPTVEGSFPFIYAARNGHRKMVKFLMRDYRIPPACQKNLALKGAALGGHERIVKMLMRHPHVNNGCHTDLP